MKSRKKSSSQKQKVDPITGLASAKSGAIFYSTFMKRKKVDPVTGEPSDNLNAISYAAFRFRKKVDPITGELSNEPNAISCATFNNRKKVDPVTGEPSAETNAISIAVFKKRKKVDPVTGEPSAEPNAISIATFKARKRVDPDTGEPSAEPNSISIATFNARKKKVNPVTGEPSIKSNAIPYNIFRNRQKVDPVTGELSKEPNAIAYTVYRKRKYKNKANAHSLVNLDLLADVPIKIEPDVSLVTTPNKPILELDRKNFKKVAAILRGESNRTDDCAYLVHAFIDYLTTGNMPSQPALMQAPSLDQVTFGYFTEQVPLSIKSELSMAISSESVETVTHSWIERNTALGNYTSVGEIPQEINGTFDLTVPPIYDVDHAIQKSAMYNELNTVLQAEARSNGGISFGMVNIAPSGEDVDALWHCMVYYATSSEAVYIDCQQKDNSVFENIEERFLFKMNQRTIGNIVFYTPCCPTPLVNQQVLEEETFVPGKRERAKSDTEKPRTKRQRLIAPNNDEDAPDAMDINDEGDALTYPPRQNASVTQFGFFANANTNTEDSLPFQHTNSSELR